MKVLIAMLFGAILGLFLLTHDIVEACKNKGEFYSYFGDIKCEVKE